ncbi:MAG: hypothetical protein J5949_06115 [Oscillospiraceae bacterium]|nr:hypothetical protein [Oscillospiraceae bacterium]
MDNSIFRKKSLDRISSPEELSETLHVTSPAVWMILTAIILILAGVIIWGSIASIDSIVTGTAQVKDGSMHITYDDRQFAKDVEPGMKVTAGEHESRITSVGTDENGEPFAVASTTLADGSYAVKVVFRQTQVLRLLFN